MIENPYAIAEHLWTCAQRHGGEGLKDKRFEVDPETRRQMQMDHGRYMGNFNMIGHGGKPVEEYRDGWDVAVVYHRELPEAPVYPTDGHDRTVVQNDGPTPHMALVATKPNGRQITFDWEGNHVELR